MPCAGITLRAFLGRRGRRLAVKDAPCHPGNSAARGCAFFFTARTWETKVILCDATEQMVDFSGAQVEYLWRGREEKEVVFAGSEPRELQDVESSVRNLPLEA